MMLFIRSHATIMMHHNIGQTKRQLKTRIIEHSSDINKESIKNPSVISNHWISLDHNFDWNKIKILDRKLSYNKRLTSEMIFIKRQKIGLNLQSDTESLPEIYSPVI